MAQLYLIPNSLGGPAEAVATSLMRQLASEIRIYIVEEIKSARRWLRQLGYTGDFSDITFHFLNEHTSEKDIEALMLPLVEGHSVGLMSEAGTPCIADPGSTVVRMAHAYGFRVVPLSGPNAMLLALMASGLNGQNWAFSGYLPRDPKERNARVRKLEQWMLDTGQTQLFMDAPYRNDQVLRTLIDTLRPTTLLCIASNITTDHEWISTKSVAEWKKNPPQLNKRPVVFAIGK
jgi:16S rRNA (cytidine1402-2'-O)-methyltransferase